MGEASLEIIRGNHNLLIRYSYVALGKPKYVPPHWHDSIEIIYVKKGKLELVMGKQKDQFTAGTFCIIGKNLVHATYHEAECEYLLLQVPFEFMTLFLNDVKQQAIPYVSSNSMDLEQAKKYRAQLQKIYVVRDDAYQFPVDMQLKFYGDLFLLLSDLFADYGRKVTKAQMQDSEKYIDRLATVSGFVETHYTEPITLQDGARLLNLNEAYFARFFKKYMGVTFMDYVYAIRLKAAAQEIVESDLTIQSIMEKNGFTNPKYFNKLFSNQYQMSPLAFRKSLRKDNAK